MGGRMRRILAVTILFGLILYSSTAGAQEPPSRGDDPEVEITAPESYTAKKIALFPLELPIYAFKFALWPLTEGMGYLERKYVFDRAADFLSNDAKTIWFYPIISWGAGVNFGGGIGFKAIDLFHDKYVLNAEYTINIALNQNAKLSLAKDRAFSLWGAPVSFWTGVEFDRNLNADYYGVGSDSLQGNRSRYTINGIDWDGQLHFGLGSNVDIETSVGVTSATTGPSTYGGYPSVITTFGAANLPGIDRWLTYVRLGLGVAHDTRDNREMPRLGGLQSLHLYRYQCLSNNTFSFNEFVFNVEHYFPLWRPGIVFHARTNWVFQQRFGGEQVPFYRLDLLDYQSPLRGFKSGRFRDISSALFNFEYMFPISSVIGGIIFVDTGRVFDGAKNFSFDEWKYSVGGGLDLHIFKVTLINFRVGYGGEGVNLMFGMSKTI